MEVGEGGQEPQQQNQHPPSVPPSTHTSLPSHTFTSADRTVLFKNRIVLELLL